MSKAGASFATPLESPQVCILIIGRLLIPSFLEHAGIFVDNAMALVPTPPWAPEQYSDFFNIAVAETLKFGLTSVHDAFTDPAAVAFFKGFVIPGC